MFKELVMGDKLYYIDPKTPTTISEITVKEVRKSVQKDYVVIVYFKSDEATNVLIKHAHHIDDSPVGKIHCPKNASEMITVSMPPSIYATNKKWLEKFMHQ